jgi:hypothetical protein
VGVGVGVGAEGAAGVLAVLFGLGFGFGFFGAGSEPDGANATSCGAAATCTGLTADGAAVFLELLPALAIPKAAPNATRAATTPMATSFPGVISSASWEWSSPEWCN